MSDEISQDRDITFLVSDLVEMMDGNEEDGINLGSVDEFFMDFNIPLEAQDEYLIDEINELLAEHNLELEEDHTQLFLNRC